MKLSVRETVTNMEKVPLLVRLPKQVINSHFHSSHFFRSIFSQPVSVIFFLSMFPFVILEIKKITFNVSSAPVRRVSYLDGWPNTNTPYCNKFFFFFFFFFFFLSFPRRYLRDRSFFMREGGLVGFGKHHLKIAWPPSAYQFFHMAPPL